MHPVIKKAYNHSPIQLKRLFATAEAVRRNRYRRKGQYHTYYSQVDIEKILAQPDPDRQLQQLRALLAFVYQGIPFYQKNKSLLAVERLDQLSLLPIVSKKEIMENQPLFLAPKDQRKLWSGSTSGATGCQFYHFRDVDSVRYEYAVYDRLYAYVAKRALPVRARISSVSIASPQRQKPPFWYYVPYLHQLQCSAYHISPATFRDYLQALPRYQVDLGTGYASAWLHLAQCMQDTGFQAPRLAGLVTDSEGISDLEKELVQKVFDCPVWQTYGLSEVGLLAVQCRANHYHLLTGRCLVEILDDDGQTLPAGTYGEIVVTDLRSWRSPFIRYRTGDLGRLGRKPCPCGWKSPYIEALCGRIDDYILTPEGRKIRRLGQVSKAAQDILGMQLIQQENNQVLIHVQPGRNFSERSMAAVVDMLRVYLPDDMAIDWSMVDRLELTNAGKLKFIIRRLN